MRRRRLRQPWIQFSLKTAALGMAAICAVVTMFRGDCFSVIAGLVLLYTIFVFAEDIWDQLPR